MYFNTKKQLPDTIETRSGQLLLKGGFISKSSRGVYFLNPLGSAFLDHIFEEMEAILKGYKFQKVQTPILNLKQQYEDENKFLTTDKDRKSFFLADEPYYEFQEMIRTNITSYRQLPIRLYEYRPRLKNIFKPNRELLNCYESKELVIMIADINKQALQKKVVALIDDLQHLLDNWRLDIVKTMKANGAGLSLGTATEWSNLESLHNQQDDQYYSCNHVENDMTYCVKKDEEILQQRLVDTPGIRTISDLSVFLNTERNKLLKSVLLNCNGKKTAVFLRGDRNLSIEKLAHNLGILPDRISPLKDNDVISSGGVPGFIGPMGLHGITTIIDKEVVNIPNLVTGANREGYHLKNMNYGVDFVCDFLMDISVCHMDKLDISNEFKLTKQTMILNLFNFEQTQLSNKDIIETTYAKIDLYELMAIIVEKNSIDGELILPQSIAPCKFYIVLAETTDPIRAKLETLIGYATDADIYVDDRKAGIGFKIREGESIGAPYIIIIGKKSEDDSYEWIDRKKKEKLTVSFNKLRSLIDINSK
jgi:prolyl-tRNA synthetase